MSFSIAADSISVLSVISQSPRHGRITAVSGKRATHETSRCRSAGAYCIEKDASITRESIHDKRSYFTTYHSVTSKDCKLQWTLSNIVQFVHIPPSCSPHTTHSYTV